MSTSIKLDLCFVAIAYGHNTNQLKVCTHKFLIVNEIFFSFCLIIYFLHKEVTFSKLSKS